MPVRADLVDATPYGAPQLDAPVRLNTNETAEPPPADFLAEVARRLQALPLQRYPDREHRQLRARLASAFDLDPGRVWAANGSNEVLLQLLLAYGGPGRSVLLFRPGYSLYPELARDSLTTVVAADLDDRFELSPDTARAAVATHAPDIVVVAHPNNPTGLPVALDAVRDLHDRSGALIVVDEAYIEFSDAASAVTLLAELPRLVVVRTFSKAYRLAGLRLGYMLGQDWVVDDLHKVRLPYHLDAVKQVAGVVALEQSDHFLDHRARVAAERDRVTATLDRLPRVRTWPSVANFVLFRSDVPELFQRLLDRGVLVRDVSAVPRLGGCLRATVGTPAENDAFLAAVTAVVEEG